MTTDLFEPVTLGGDLVLPNRIVMAPLTRSRVQRRRRARAAIRTRTTTRSAPRAGLIVSEATQHQRSRRKGYAMTPGHLDGGAGGGRGPMVTAGRRMPPGGADRAASSGMCGRISQSGPCMPRRAACRWRPSDDASPNGQAFTKCRHAGRMVTPRGAGDGRKSPRIVADYRHAAGCAKRGRVRRGGGAFRQQLPAGAVRARRAPTTRTDRYGGSVENRAALSAGGGDRR